MNLNIGRKVRALRLGSNLTQEELANRARLTKGFISQLENDQTSISVDSLADILDALGVTLNDFFDDSTETKVSFHPSERVAVEETGARKFEILVPGSTNNIMDPVMIELGPGDSLAKRGPRPGEQFGFVLKGTATLKLSKKSYKIPRQHCFYFTADQPHQICNVSDGTVSLLLVTSPPQM
jgi:transcriptional regulator with XRE-family HTH domain